MFIDAVIGITEKQLGAVFEDVRVTCNSGGYMLQFNVSLTHRGKRYGYSKAYDSYYATKSGFYDHAVRTRFAAEVCRETTAYIMEGAL